MFQKPVAVISRAEKITPRPTDLDVPDLSTINYTCWTLLLGEAIEAFLYAKKSERVSQRTFSWYVYQLNKFKEFTGNIHLKDIASTLIRQYLMAAEERKNAIATIKGMVIV